MSIDSSIWITSILSIMLCDPFVSIGKNLGAKIEALFSLEVEAKLSAVLDEGFLFFSCDSSLDVDGSSEGCHRSKSKG